MINFETMRNQIKKFDEQRELLIKKSRDVLKLSKQTIYAVHRDDLKEALKLEKIMKEELKVLNDYVKNIPKMYNQGSYKVAVQEYVEASLFLHFVKSKKLLTHKDLGVNYDYYLLGIGDLPGELYRRAVLAATKGKYEEVTSFRKLVDEIYAELLKMDIRESELRKKFDGIKYDLQKLEDLEFKVKRKK